MLEKQQNGTQKFRMPKLITNLRQVAATLSRQPRSIFDLTASAEGFELPEVEAKWATSTIYTRRIRLAERYRTVILDCEFSSRVNWLNNQRQPSRLNNESTASLFTATLDGYCAASETKQIDLLLLPATVASESILIGAHRLMSTGRIVSIAFVAESGQLQTEVLSDRISRLIAKFDYSWVVGDGLISLAVHDRAQDLMLCTSERPLDEIWASEASRCSIDIRGAIHIGASEGQFVELYRRKGAKKVFLVEADPSQSSKLKKHFEKSDYVVCVDVAISDRSGRGTLHVASDGHSSSLLAPSGLFLIHPDVKFPGSIEVETRTLDSLSQEYDFSACNFLNVDTSGAELLALIGAKNVLPQIEIINCNINYSQVYEACAEIEEIDAYLAKFGFVRVATETRIELDWGNAVYLRMERMWKDDPLLALAIVLRVTGEKLKSVVCSGHETMRMMNCSLSSLEFELKLVDRSERGVTLRIPDAPAVRENRIAKFEVAYEISHSNDTPARRAVESELVLPDCTVLALHYRSYTYFADVALPAMRSSTVSVVVLLGTLTEVELEKAIAAAFDRGFLLDRLSATSSGRVFIRSSQIVNPIQWLEQNNELGRRDFRFSFLGEVGQYGNQLFQMWHVLLSSLRYHAKMGICKWSYNSFFDLGFLECPGRGPVLWIDPSDWRVMGLWGREQMPERVDFYGHFQWIAPFLGIHRRFLTGCFELQFEWARKVHEILCSIRKIAGRIAVFHVRRSDYLEASKTNPWMQEIPSAWYRDALKSLGVRAVYAASDDLDFVEKEFSDFHLITCKQFCDCGLPPALIDHCVMRAADELLLVNSTFSRSAAMIANEAQDAFLPNIYDKKFEHYKPWADPVFWFRFQFQSSEALLNKSSEVSRWLNDANVPVPVAGVTDLPNSGGVID